MLSPTQRRLVPADIEALVRRSFGAHTGVVECAELNGGTFATVWRALLTDGRKVVLKVGPRPDVPILTYELDLIAAEAEYFRLIGERAPGVPVPEVLHSEPDWLITALLPGTPLCDLIGAGNGELTAAEEAGIRRQLGAALAQVHKITGRGYGYPGGRRAHGTSWRAAFLAIIDELLADAERLRVALAVPPERIVELVHRHAHELDVVTRPALVHWDLWDGNVLVERTLGGAVRLSGLVDGERYLYGDPLVDFVSPVLFRRIEDLPEHPFLAGYAEAADAPVVLDAGARRRLSLYRVHMYLVMNVEPVTRGTDGADDSERGAYLAGLLTAELADLDRPLPH